MELIRRRLKNLKVIIRDEEFILHILNNLPSAYESTAELCEDALGNGTLTMMYLKEKLRSKYRRTKKISDAKMDSVALYNKQQFKGSCTVCGKIVTREWIVSPWKRTKKRKKPSSRNSRRIKR